MVTPCGRFADQLLSVHPDHGWRALLCSAALRGDAVGSRTAAGPKRSHWLHRRGEPCPQRGPIPPRQPVQPGGALQTPDSDGQRGQAGTAGVRLDGAQGEQPGPQAEVPVVGSEGARAGPVERGGIGLPVYPLAGSGGPGVRAGDAA